MMNLEDLTTLRDTVLDMAVKPVRNYVIPGLTSSLPVSGGERVPTFKVESWMFKRS